MASVASSLTVLPVITLTVLEFAPFKSTLTFVVSRHASDPYVSIHTAHTSLIYPHAQIHIKLFV